MTELSVDSDEQILREELGRGDAVIAASRPILRHLVANDDQGLFNDEAVARIRGMMTHVASQLLFAQGAAAARDPAEYAAERQDALVQALCEETAFLAHAHALTLEAQIAERLRVRGGIDSVLTPLVQELAAAREGETAGLAMAVLASQARFMQYHRRMELPLSELPGDLFHRALLTLRSQQRASDEQAVEAERRLRESFDEGAGRLGLLTRLVMTTGQEAARALAIDQAGLAIFSTALAMASGQERHLTVLSLANRRFTRFALGLRAAGLEQRAVEEHFLYLHPQAALPQGFDALPPDRAAALLAGSRPEAAI